MVRSTPGGEDGAAATGQARGMLRSRLVHATLVAATAAAVAGCGSSSSPAPQPTTTTPTLSKATVAKEAKALDRLKAIGTRLKAQTGIPFKASDYVYGVAVDSPERTLGEDEGPYGHVSLVKVLNPVGLKILVEHPENAQQPGDRFEQPVSGGTVIYYGDDLWVTSTLKPSDPGVDRLDKQMRKALKAA